MAREALTDVMPISIEEGKKRKLLGAIRDGRVESIEPTLDFEGRVRYPAVEDLVGGTTEEAERVLTELSEKGILRSEVVEKLAICPACGSHKFLVEVRCPYCESPKVERLAMAEHLPCGYVDRMENFVKGGQLVCPKCGKALRTIGENYRRLGILYRCNSCGRTFAEPERQFRCNAEHVFDEDEIMLREIKAFKANPDKKPLIELEVIDFAPLLEEAARSGWLGRAPAIIRGKTGIEHEFKLAIWKGADDAKGPPYIVVEAIGREGELSANDVLAFRAKSQDVMSKENILVGIRVDKKGKLFAKSYGIHIVEGEKTRDFEEQIKNLFVNLMKEEIKSPGGGLETVLGQLDQEIMRAETKKAAEMWVCSKCKAANPEARAYCYNCGAMRTQKQDAVLI